VRTLTHSDPTGHDVLQGPGSARPTDSYALLPRPARFCTSPRGRLDKWQPHRLNPGFPGSRDALGMADAASAGSVRFREAAHVQFDSALIYSVSRFIQGGHFQA